MKTTVRATYSNGTFTPEFALDFEEGEEVTLTVEPEPHLSFRERIEITRSSAGGWKGLHDPAEFKRMISEARRKGSRAEPTP
jgi:predicted DNA-binding antitoxin AbrB/MazE fold protein